MTRPTLRLPFLLPIVLFASACSAAPGDDAVGGEAALTDGPPPWTKGPSPDLDLPVGPVHLTSVASTEAPGGPGAGVLRFSCTARAGFVVPLPATATLDLSGTSPGGLTLEMGFEGGGPFMNVAGHHHAAVTHAGTFSSSDALTSGSGTAAATGSLSGRVLTFVDELKVRVQATPNDEVDVDATCSGTVVLHAP